MAINKWFYLDKTGLSQYDALIKAYIDDADALSIKYLTFEPAQGGGTNPTTIKFWKVDPTGTGATAAYTVTLPDASTLMTKVLGATSGNIAELNSSGQVVDSGVSADSVLTKLATGTAGAIVTANADGTLNRSTTLLSNIISKSTDSGATFTSGQWAVFDSNGRVKGVSATATNVGYSAPSSGATSESDNVQDAIDALNDAIATAGEVTVIKKDTADTGYAASYYVKQNGVQQGATIQIPKDFLVKSAELKTCTVPDVPVEGYEVGDKYIDFTVNTVDSTAQESHIYLLVKDLVDTYTAGTDPDGYAALDISNYVITPSLTSAAKAALVKADNSLQPVTTATAGNIVTFTSTGRLADSGKSINDLAGDVIADAYNPSSTYALGDYVMYNGKLYECVVAISTAESWTPAHWSETKVMNAFQPIPASYIQGLFA